MPANARHPWFEIRSRTHSIGVRGFTTIQLVFSTIRPKHSWLLPTVTTHSAPRQSCPTCPRTPLACGRQSDGCTVGVALLHPRLLSFQPYRAEDFRTPAGVHGV